MRQPIQPPTRSIVNRIQRRREKGQSMIEMGILLPLILVIVIGIVEVADALNGYITIVNAARDGARLGSKNLADDSEITSLILIETERLRDPVTAGDVSIDHTTFNGDEVVRVQVCNDRSLILGVPLILPDTFRMCSTTTMRVLPPSDGGSGPPPPTDTPGGPTDTPAPTNTPGGNTPTNTPLPPTNTPVPPTNTPVPPDDDDDDDDD